MFDKQDPCYIKVIFPDQITMDSELPLVKAAAIFSGGISCGDGEQHHAEKFREIFRFDNIDSAKTFAEDILKKGFPIKGWSRNWKYVGQLNQISVETDLDLAHEEIEKRASEFVNELDNTINKGMAWAKKALNGIMGVDVDIQSDKQTVSVETPAPSKPNNLHEEIDLRASIQSYRKMVLTELDKNHWSDQHKHGMQMMLKWLDETVIKKDEGLRNWEDVGKGYPPERPYVGQ